MTFRASKQYDFIKIQPSLTNLLTFQQLMLPSSQQFQGRQQLLRIRQQIS